MPISWKRTARWRRTGKKVSKGLLRVCRSKGPSLIIHALHVIKRRQDRRDHRAARASLVEAITDELVFQGGVAGLVHPAVRFGPSADDHHICSSAAATPGARMAPNLPFCDATLIMASL
ncbi:MAG: hypothetical protein GY850_39965 [bacterium]|nr:hypothetical protein [bacterium]